jgi:hypothetical protein
MPRKHIDILINSLIIPIEKKKILQQITERIGSLGQPSKMPGYSWSIPAKYCNIGNKLRLVKGTTCNLCYAKKGRYSFLNVQNAMERRLQGWLNDPDWSLLMAIRLLWIQEDYFRWFDSGDLQSNKMLIDINKIALLTPNVRHWLPTQERSIVHNVGTLADNLTVRFSSVFIDKPTNQGHLSALFCTSSVTRAAEKATCSSFLTNGYCGDCRACWDKSVKNITYLVH